MKTTTTFIGLSPDIGLRAGRDVHGLWGDHVLCVQGLEFSCRTPRVFQRKARKLGASDT